MTDQQQYIATRTKTSEVYEASEVYFFHTSYKPKFPVSPSE